MEIIESKVMFSIATFFLSRSTLESLETSRISRLVTYDNLMSMLRKNKQPTYNKKTSEEGT